MNYEPKLGGHPLPVKKRDEVSGLDVTIERNDTDGLYYATLADPATGEAFETVSATDLWNLEEAYGVDGWEPLNR